jgi:Ulp1 family protease
LDLLGLKKDWKLEPADVPQQKGTSDCGVFTLQNMKFSMFREKLPQCTEEDMKWVRFTMILELAEQAIRWKEGLH